MSDEARSGTQHSAGKNEKTAPRPANIPASLSGCRSEHAFHISLRPRAARRRLPAHRPAGFGAFRPPSKKSIALLTTAGNNGILKKIGNYQQKVR